MNYTLPEPWSIHFVEGSVDHRDARVLQVLKSMGYTVEFFFESDVCHRSTRQDIEQIRRSGHVVMIAVASWIFEGTHHSNYTILFGIMVEFLIDRLKRFDCFGVLGCGKFMHVSLIHKMKI